MFASVIMYMYAACVHFKNKVLLCVLDVSELHVCITMYAACIHFDYKFLLCVLNVSDLHICITIVCCICATEAQNHAHLLHSSCT